MSGSMLYVVLPLAALYAVFLVWYGGSGRPLTREEIDGYLAALRRNANEGSGLIRLSDVERMLERDDGREFIMHNVIRYRQKALYPPGSGYGDSAPAADRRYGKAVLPHLLRYGNLPVFIARRSGSFVEPEGIDRWDVVAMVRYRSRCGR